MPKLAIRAHGLSKRYRLGTSIFATPGGGGANGAEEPGGKASAAQASNGNGQRIRDSWIWALRDLDLEVSEGDLLGIVGPNGAGKSTLLKLLSRITAPTSGRGEVYGRVGSLLEVGTGFNWELTGRENVYLNGMILGMTKREIASRFDEIVAFSGTGAFIDTPIKRYSSGMVARLGFAVAAHLETDILVVDEVLAVGDVAFQRKCLERMRTLAGQQGKSVLFVSHNAESVIDLCSRAIWLDEGRLKAAGDPRTVLQAYLGAGRANGNGAAGALTIAARGGSGDLQITGGSVSAPGSNAVNQAIVGQPMTIRLTYHAPRKDLIAITFTIGIRDRHGRKIASLSTRVRGQDFPHLEGEGTVECRIEKCPLLPGSYALDLEASWPGTALDQLPGALAFEVLPGRYFAEGLVSSPDGLLFLDHEWSEAR